jgi:hypothetical protein
MNYPAASSGEYDSKRFNAAITKKSVGAIRDRSEMKDQAQIQNGSIASLSNLPAWLEQKILSPILLAT